MTSERPPTIDPQAAEHWRQTLHLESPWLHEEVARRMEDRLQWITLKPKTWAHWEPLRGGLQAHDLLARRYPDSTCFVMEALTERTQVATDLIAKPWWSPKRWTAAPTRFAAPPDGTADMLWANMALHMAADPQALIGQWHRALAVDGFLMFSCFGPDTLRELRGLYQQLGWPAPSHEFTDMHDWGDMLVHAGFAEPVMDMERITLSFESPQRLLQELRPLGRNLHPGRFAGLRGRGWRDQLHQQLAQQLVNPAEEGRLTLTFEIIYGHAMKARPKLKVQPETSLSLDDMRMALRQGKPQGAGGRPARNEGDVGV
jgi:malonyl-CoA O-methyltransferase